MGNTSSLRIKIHERDNDGLGLIALLEEAGEGAPDLINEDFTSDCLFSCARNVQSPLHTSVALHRITITETLLRYGGDVNMTGRNGMTPLHYAAKNGHLEMCKLLVKYGADNKLEDNKGGRPIHAAAMSPVIEKEQKDDVLVYLTSGDVGSPDDVNATDVDERTPLYIAASWSYVYIATWLVEHGARKDAKDRLGRTPLAVSRGRDSDKLTELLTEK